MTPVWQEKVSRGRPLFVVSQWNVQHADTRDLIVNFYRVLIAQAAARKKPIKAEALRQAVFKLMKNAEIRHPSYLAGLVLSGDGR